MKNFTLFLLGITLLFFSCTNVHNPQVEAGGEAGTLTISVTDNVSRIILPDISMDIAFYKAIGSGPDGARFEETFSGLTKELENLTQGPWSVIVNAYNSSDILIGRGSGTVTVRSDAPGALNITVLPLIGNGTLNLSLYWNSGDVLNPQVQSTLAPYQGAIRNLAFVTGNGSAQFNSSDIAAGYHTLVLKLLDDTSLVMGAVEVVRIAADAITNGSFTFDGINKAKGIINVEITPEMAEPLEIVIQGGAGTKTPEATMYLTALTTNYAGNVTYVWYVNGDSVATGADFSFDSAWSTGNYRIDLTGYSADGKRAGSASRLVKEEESVAVSPASWFTYTISNDEVTITGLSQVWEDLDAPEKNYLEIPAVIEGWPVRYLEAFTFRDHSSLISVTIPDSVTTIGGMAFFSCVSLISVTIPDSVTPIYGGTFHSCNSLSSITIPDSVTSIGASAFYGCSSLTSVTIPDSVTFIGNSAFCYCISLTSVTIPDSVTSTGYAVFHSCSSLTSITIPDSVTTIENYTFYGCSGLTSITIPDSVTYIGDLAFTLCNSLTSLTIPDSVTSIGNNVFQYCTSLTSATIPDSVTYIGYSAFAGCTSLTSVTIPGSVTSIENWAFSGCNSLTSVIIPDSVTSIGDRTFIGCSSLTSVTIPDSVTSIGYEAFRNCYNLESVILNPLVPLELGDYVFDYNKSVRTFFVPPASVEAYKTAPGWSEYAEWIVSQ